MEAKLPTVSEIIYGELRNRIIDGSYAPGDRLNADEIARNLSASKTPVREALGRLEHDGLISFRSREGWRVPSLSQIEFIEALEVREALQLFIAERLHSHANRIDFESLEKINKEAASLNGADDMDRKIFLDDAFHLIIFSVYPNATMVIKLKEIGGIIYLQRKHLMPPNFNYMKFSLNTHRHHEDIMSVLRGGTPKEIAKMCTEHAQLLLKELKKKWANVNG